MSKKIIYTVLISLFAVVFFNSCEDEDTIRFNIDDFEKGVMPFFDIAEGSDPGFNPDDLAGSSITLIVDLRAQETEQLVASADDNVSSIEIKAVYDNLLAPLEVPDEGIVATVTAWPAEVTLTPQDMVDALDSLSSLADMSAGDVFTLTQRIVLKDGSVIDGIENENTIEVYDSAGVSLGELTYNTFDNDLIINESGRNVFDWNVFVNCASDISGSYTMESSGEIGYGWGDPAAIISDWTSTVEVTLTNVGLGVYECDACIGGMMVDAYGAFGTMRTGRIILLCDNSVQGVGITDGFNPLLFYEGSYDSATGKITVSWANPWGDSGTSVYTPN